MFQTQPREPRESTAGSARRPLPDRLVLPFCVAAALGLLCLGLLTHPRPSGGGELDAYVRIAEALRQGAVPNDVYHPLTYPLLVAVAAIVLPGTFVAAQVLSAAAFGVLLGAVYRLLRREVSAGAALLGCLAVGLGPAVWIEGMRAATDMTGSALILAAFALLVTDRIGKRRLALIGLLLGAAVTTRYSLALLALPAAAMAMARGRARFPWPLGVGALLGVLPHALVRSLAHGTAFGTDNWKNIVLKYEFARDGESMRSFGDGRLAALLAEHWPSWLGSGLHDAANWLWTGLPRMQLAEGAPLSPWVAAAAVAAVFAAVVAAIRSRRTARSWLLLGFSYAACINVVFFPEPRIVLPATILIAIGTLTALPRMAVVLALGLAALHASAVGSTFRGFAGERAGAELRAARAIVEAHGELVQIAATDPFVGDEVRCARVVPLLGFGNRRDVSFEEFWRRLEGVGRDRAVSWFVIGRRSGGLLFDLAARASLPPRWTRPRAEREVVVLRHRLLRLPLAVESDDDGIRLCLRSPDDPPGEPAWIGVVLRGPDGSEHRLELTAKDGGYELRVPILGLAPGRWRAWAALLRADGLIVQGDPVEFPVGG